jgi:hypothetical protein
LGTAETAKEWFAVTPALVDAEKEEPKAEGKRAELGDHRA